MNAKHLIAIVSIGLVSCTAFARDTADEPQLVLHSTASRQDVRNAAVEATRSEDASLSLAGGADVTVQEAQALIEADGRSARTARTPVRGADRFAGMGWAGNVPATN